MARAMPVRSAEGAKLRVCALMLIGGVTLSGCATMIRGTTQRVTVVTDPPGAECTLTVKGTEGSQRIAETPGSAEVHRGNETLTATCAKQGQLDAVERFEAKPAGSADTTEQQVLMAGSGAAIAGGIAAGLYATATSSLAMGMGGGVVATGAAVSPLLIGAVAVVPISLVVDYSSGAMYEYPSVIVMLMPPARFPDEDARNAYFADLDARFRAAYDKRRREHEDRCLLWACERYRKQDEAFLADRLAWLAAQREKTTIVVSRPPESP